MKKLLSLSVILLLPLLADTASAGSCRNAIETASKQIFGKALGTACANINTSQKSNSPFVYVNPDSGCNLGLQMPGLPTFGASLGQGLDMCKLAKTVTGGMVNTVNSELRSKMDTVVNGINTATQNAIGTSVANGNVNVSTTIMDQINNQAQGLQTPGFVK